MKYIRQLLTRSLKSVLSVVLLGTVALAGATAWQARAREAAAESAYPPAGQFVTVAGRRVHALVRGTGPDLVLIHGASGSLRDFSFELVDQLARDFRVIALDRPGFGWSDPLPEAQDLQASTSSARGRRASGGRAADRAGSQLWRRRRPCLGDRRA